MVSAPSVRPPFLTDRRCPCCDAAAGRVAVASNPRGEDAAWPDLQESWRGFFKQKIFLSYARCERCGLLYARRYFTDAALIELYGHMPDNSAGLAQAQLEWTQQGYFDFLREHSDLGGDYFELGPDIGLFTQFVAAGKASGRFWLYEPNAVVHPELRRRAQGHAVEIRPEMTDFSAVPDASIRVCVMIHVLDHLPDARGLLQQVRRKLTADARVLIVTHDERSLLARVLGPRWPAYCLQHSQLFSRDSTRRFLEACGLEVVETRKSTNYFPATYLLKHLLFAVGLRALAAKLRGDSFVLPLRLGNIMTVARPR